MFGTFEISLPAVLHASYSEVTRSFENADRVLDYQHFSCSHCVLRRRKEDESSVLCWLFLYLTKGTACSYLLEVWCVMDQKSEKLGHADNSIALPKGHRVLFKRGGLIILDVKQ